MASRLLSLLTALSFSLSHSLVAGAAFAAATNAPKAAPTALTIAEITDTLQSPWGLQVLPDGRFLVTERAGRMRIVTPEGKVSDPIAGLPHVVHRGQGGLLDVLLAPDFASSGLIYFTYAEPRGGFSNGTAAVRAKLILEGAGGRIENGEIIFRQQPAAASFYHFGSRLAFDTTGALFITTGERADLREAAQDLTTHLGKVIRIAPDGSIPPGNPYASNKGYRPEVWSYGHRNIQGAAVDPATGKLWITEHGPKGGDELNQAEAGKNYGWPVITYGIEYSGKPVGRGMIRKEGLEQPVYYWKPSIGTSCLAFYTGGLFKDWNGNLLAGGLAGERLERLVLKDGQVIAVEHLLAGRDERVRDVRIGPGGEVYVLTDGEPGKLLRLTPKS